MAVTPDTLTATYPWMKPKRDRFPSQNEYDKAIASLNLELQSQIDLYQGLFGANAYGDCVDLALSLYIAHIRRLNDEECIRIQTALKQMEGEVSLSLDNVLAKTNADFLLRTIYGQQLEQLRMETVAAMSMIVI